MILAALISAGASRQEISRSLERLGVPFTLETGSVEVNGVRALQASVGYPEEDEHRALGDIEALIEKASFPRRATRRAIEAFRLLAAAEGKVHGTEPEEVAFHEVGAVDSIVDVVGSCLALESLGVGSVSCGPLPMGHGVVRAAHGPLPVPGPATLELLRGSSVRWTEEPHEMTTPTGAALMRALTDEAGGGFTDAAPPMTLSAVGYGAGSARFKSVPNLLRAVAGDLEGAAEDVELLEANVDDAPGEILGAATERLLGAGALDAWLEPVTMKRGRGAYKVCALVRAADGENLVRLLMRETGSLGVRRHAVGRTVAERRVLEVELPYGKCRVKVGSLDGEDFVAAPEYADAARLAAGSGLPLLQVYADARSAFTRMDEDSSGSGQ